MNLNDYINKSKKLVRDNSMKHTKIAFLSNFTITGLAETIKVRCFKYGIYAEDYTAPYNQYAQEILNKSSNLYNFNPDIIFIILDTENLLGDFYYFHYRINGQKRSRFIKEKFDEIKNLITILKENTSAKIVVNNLLVPYYSSRGIIENKQEWGIKKCVKKFNDMLESISTDDSQLFIFDINSFYSKVGFEKIHDRKMSYLGDIKISPYGLVKLSSEYMSYIYPLTSMTKKCIVLDLDNTLWGGIIGEDDVENIKLGPEKEGKPFLDFQKRLLELFERGIILAINSKNNYEDVIEFIRNHKYMLLKEDNFACIKINWQDKATNTKEIAKELNIGLDSMVFIDDDKTNRELIKKFIPEILVLEVPEDPSSYPEIIENLNVFNLFTITGDDLKRGKTYIDQKKRKTLKSEATDIKSFLKQLEIKIDVIEASKANIPRIAQLTQKTNQFNITTRRYQEENIKNFSESINYLVKCIDVKDKFGDYGITGVVIIKKYDTEGYWDIDSFLLSCRILGKDIEFSLMQNIIDEAKKTGVKEIHGTFIPTKKNKPAKNFLKECGFILDEEKEGKKHYILKVGKEKKRDSYVEVREWKP